MLIVLLIGQAFQSTLSARRATDESLKIATKHARFQSTLSARRATLGYVIVQSVNLYFNPRSPRGERRRVAEKVQNEVKFQSTLSARRATTVGDNLIHTIIISIHALREESDVSE